MTTTDCIFCKIVAGDMPSYQVWEDEKHLAFLTIFPNTEGVTVVIPKQHYASYIFDLPDQVYSDLLLATKKVGKLLDAAFEDVGRTGLICEGFGVDHVHAKLYPMHGTALSEWKPIESAQSEYFKQYPGYLSSHDYTKEEDVVLQATVEKIKKAQAS